jgi:hypothetical protein
MFSSERDEEIARLQQLNIQHRREIERLRAALTQIKNLDAKHGMVNNEAKVMDAFIIALKALRLDGQVDALDYPMLYEKALAEIERLQLVIQSEMTPTEIAQQLAECNVLADAYAEQNVTVKELRAEIERLKGLLWQEAGNRVEIERLRDVLEQAVDDFGEGHCVCEQTKQQCIDALKEGE